MAYMSVVILMMALNISSAATKVCPNGFNGHCSSEEPLCVNGTTCVLDDINFTNSSGKCCLSVDITKDSKVCTEPKVSGPCDAAVQRYYYNLKKGKCDLFTWGGCNANGNNFLNEEDCRDVCGNICSQPSKQGPCKGKQKRWYYDNVDCQCKKFFYSGCKGNENRFRTKKDCQNACGNNVCLACVAEKKIGPCKAGKPRFYYDKTRGKCKGFTWGGCHANANNFETKKECNTACKTMVCKLPPKPGPCKKAVKRVYFDTDKNECKEFIWGGCKPNGNNFKSIKACKSICIPKRKK